jgi:hypothetical protein
MIMKSPKSMPASEFGRPKPVVNARPAPANTAPKGRIRNAIKAMHMPAWKVMLLSVIAGVLGAVYLQHVFTTQAILKDVNRLHRDLGKAELRHRELRFTYERMTGPADVYIRAKELGMVDGGPADQHIIIP